MIRRILITLIISILFVCQISSEDFSPINKQTSSYEYKVGAGDILEIKIWGYDDLTREVNVRADGMITYEMIGDVHVAGLNPRQLSTKLSQRLSEYLIQPTVIVKVKEIKSYKITVLGKVPKQGTLYLNGPIKILDLLSLVGYDPAKSDVQEIKIMRETGQTLLINLNRLLYDGDMSQNIVIKKNDTIHFPKTEHGYIIIDGEVNKPGEYFLEKGKTKLISDLIREAGGLTQYAVLSSSKIVRKSGQEIRINLAALKYYGVQQENFALHSGDRLVIPRVKKTKIYVFGEVDNRGTVYLDDPSPNVLKLLTQAGDKYFAVLSDVKIIRDNPLNPGHPLVFNVDLKKVLVRHDPTQNITLKNNDVVFLPQSWIGSFAEFLDEVWPTIRDGAEAVDDVKDIKEGRWDLNDDDNDDNN